MTPLRIESEEARAIADELARRTGESIEKAVTTALRERLERVAREDEAESRLREIMAIAKRAGPKWAEPWKSADPNDELYDELGLPK
jgi:antitoxin VapB